MSTSEAPSLLPVERAASRVRRLVTYEAEQHSINLPQAAKIVAYRTRTTAQRLLDLMRLRVKNVDVALYNRIEEQMIILLQRQIEGLNSELASTCGHRRALDAGAVEEIQKDLDALRARLAALTEIRR